MKLVTLETVLAWFSARLAEGHEIVLARSEEGVLLSWAFASAPNNATPPDGAGADLEAALLDAYRKAESQEKSSAHYDLFPAGGPKGA